ncbi:MAG: hypothetical protein WCQ32_00170 [bacterium]
MKQFSNIPKPSKQFKRVAIVAGSILLVIIVVQTGILQKIFSYRPKVLSTQKEQTFGDIIAIDSNNNGIPDWEERLWGLDPTVAVTNGISNRDIVMQKRAENKAAGGTDLSTASGTDKLAYGIYTTTSILDQVGNVDAGTLQDVTTPLVQNIVKPVQKKLYTINDVILLPSTINNIHSYAINFQKVIAKVHFDQDETTILSDAVQNNDYSKLDSVAQNGKEYQVIAQKLIQIKVPISIAREHLDYVNGIKTIGDTLVAAANIKNDDLLGATAIGEYSNATTLLNTAMDNLNQAIAKYDTLQQ